MTPEMEEEMMMYPVFVPEMSVETGAGAVAGMQYI